MNLKTDGAYYIGGSDRDYDSDRIFFDFQSCAEDAAYDYISVFGNDGKWMGYLELIGGDYE